MALVDIIDGITPGWAKDNRPWWYSMYRLSAVLVDALIWGVYQGRYAGMPNAIQIPGIPGYGGFEDVKSLEYIGHDEGVFQGLTESPPDYAFRLRNSQSADAGGWQAPQMIQLFEQLAGALGPTLPLMRAVFLDSSDWWTRKQDGTYLLQRPFGDGLSFNTDGTVTHDGTAAKVITWDSLTSPPTPTQGFAGRWILILYMPVDPPYGTSGAYTFNSGAIFGHVWNSITTIGPEPNPDGATFGTNSPVKLVSLVQSIVRQRQVAGFECERVIFASDPTSFNPDGSSGTPAAGTAYPDGHWGWESKFDSGTNSRIPARNSTAEYWLVPT